MKTKYFLISLIILFLITACGGATQPPAPTLTSAPPTLTIEPVTPTPTFTLTPAFTATPTLPPVPNTQAECKKSPIAFSNVGFGFPTSPYMLPTTGNVKTIALFADFEDVPASQTPEEVFSIISPNAEKFYNDISYGKMNYVLEPYFTWVRLANPSSFYSQAIRSSEGHRDFIQEAVTLADANVDFSTADSVVVIIPPEATNVGYGPAFQGLDYLSYTADGKNFSVGVTSGADLTYWGYLWLNHEKGHNMGLPDLYLYGSSNALRLVGDFSLMGNIGGFAPEYFAYERWQLGWIDDAQIFCQVDGEQTITLTAIETIGGTKAVMIPLGSSRVVVVESRKKLGYDTNLPKEGALVYLVDTAIASGEGTLVVKSNSTDLAQAPLAVGESITVSGVTITVIESNSETDTVQVIVNP
jgi:M6 family metalloprotease-like protein